MKSYEKVAYNQLDQEDLRALLIGRYQEAIRKAGYQWLEQMFADQPDCYIKFTKSSDPHYFDEHPTGDHGWGRFERQEAWRMAYNFIVEGQ